MQSAISFDVRAERIFADDVAVDLVMFAQPAALLFFVTKTLRDGKPLQRLFEFALVRRDHARQRRRHFRPQRDFAFAFVGEIEKLRDDFRAAFLSVKIGRLEDRAVPFDKPIAPRRLRASDSKM